jgi:hypothetical protein
MKNIKELFPRNGKFLISVAGKWISVKNISPLMKTFFLHMIENEEIFIMSKIINNYYNED